MAVSITISIDLNSQSIANNTSNVTVGVRASWTGGSYNLLQKSGWLTIDGTKYTFTNSFNDKQTTSGTKLLFEKTVNVTHSSTGTKTLACSASYTSGVSSGTVAASASKVLTTIPRKSTLTASNGTLGTAQTLKVTRQASSFTHTITYTCGSASGTVCTKSSNTSISWTPPLSLASQNTTGTSVSVTFTITTYNGSTSVGSNTKSITCSIPSSVKPSCSVSVTDATDIYNTYGAFVEGLSQFKVTVTPTKSYGSDIKSYKTTANGSTYTSSSFTTGVLLSSGSLTVSTTVTDKRGRSGSASVTKTVLDYSVPVISKLTVRRCNENGTDNDQGEYVQVIFSASVTSLNNKNSASYILKYKKTSDAGYTTIPFSDYTNTYSVTNASYIFPANSSSSYDVELDVKDSHNTSSRVTTASTGFTLMHWGVSGDCMGIGKIAELTGTLDIGLQTRLYGGLIYPILEPNTDLNDIQTAGFYAGENVSNYNYANCPLTSGTFTLEVLSMGNNGQVMQRLTQCHISAPTAYERTYYKSAGWGEWFGGWVYPTIGSKFTIYSDTGGSAPACRKDGRIVEVRGIVKPVSDIAGGTDMHTIFTVPVGYRPNSPVYTVCQGSGNCTWLLRVNTNGAVDFSRYRNGETTTTAAAGTWLPFQVTYFAN